MSGPDGCGSHSEKGNVREDLGGGSWRDRCGTRSTCFGKEVERPIKPVDSLLRVSPHTHQTPLTQHNRDDTPQAHTQHNERKRDGERGKERKGD